MFEKHDQLIMEVSTQYIVNAMDNFLKSHPDEIDSVIDEASAEAFVLNFLKLSKIAFFFEENENVEDSTADNLLTYCRDMASRLVLSLIFDRCEKEEDPVGIQGMRRIMIPYFLNRKQKVQDSKVIYRDFLSG